MSNLSKTFRYENADGESITFEYGHGFLINKPAGIDTVSINLSQAQGINQVGSTIQSKNVQARPVTISGVFVGDMQMEKKNLLLSVVRPDLSGKLFANEYYLNVVPTATPVIGAKAEFANFQFALLAAYPYWMKDEHVKQVLSGISYLFKFPWNMTIPYKFGEVLETQFVNVPNRGQLPAPFTVHFTAKGSVIDPKITNVTTGQFLLLNKTMVAGERIDIQITHERTYCTSSEDGDIRGALSLGSNLFRLSVGDNVLKPDATSGRENLEVEIDFATEIVGVAL